MYIKHTQCRRDDLLPKYNSSNLETFQNSKRAIYGLKHLLFIHEWKALNSKSSFYFLSSTLVQFFLFYFLCNHTVLKANSDTFNLPEYMLICLTYINLHHSDLCSTLALEVIPWLYSEYVTWLGWLYLLDIIPPKSWTLDSRAERGFPNINKEALKNVLKRFDEFFLA